MTKLELKINGEPFEIELHDGVQVSLEKGKMTVRRGPEEQVPQMPSSYLPYYPPGVVPMQPTITWRTGTVTVSGPDDNAGWTIVPIQ